MSQRIANLVNRVVGAEPAVALAALRIVVPAMILATAELRNAPRLASTPPALLLAPEGLGWFVAHAPIGPSIAVVVQAICVFSALAAIVGIRARVALAVMTASAYYLFALSQLAGAVWHDMHLLWMGALLVASPCDHALAYDRGGPRHGPPPPDSRRYGLPLTFARLILAGVYFFPGLHKLRTSGLAWALSDNLQHQMWWKWAQHGVTHPWRVDLVPVLLQVGGLFVLVFELSFPFIVLVRRLRPWLALAGVAFHLLATVTLRIPFVSLWALYVVLVDPRAVVVTVRRWLGSGADRRASDQEETAGAHPPGEGVAVSRERLSPGPLVVGVLLVLGIVIQGARGQMRSYPFACYPTFEWMAGAEMPDLAIEIETDAGQWMDLPHARDRRGYRTQRQWGEIWSLAGVTAPVDDARLRAYAARALAEVAAHPSRGSGAAARAVASAGRGTRRVRCYRLLVSVDPDRRGQGPVSSVLLAELELPPTQG